MSTVLVGGDNEDQLLSWDALIFAACSGLKLPQCHWREEGEVDVRRWRGGSTEKQMSITMMYIVQKSSIRVV